MDEDFPRGGTERKEKAPEKKKEKELFKEERQKKLRKVSKEKTSLKKSIERDRKTVKRQGEKKIKHLKEKKDEQELPCVLAKKTLQPGVLVLVSIRKISDYKLEVDLPNALKGVIPITNISQAYTDSLQRFAEEEESSEEVHTLMELFKVGMTLPCKVVEVKPSIKLTLNPSEVNGTLKTQNLSDGLCLFGSVVSQEDHGYVVDIGVCGIKAFLPNKNAGKFIKQQNDGAPLKVGQCVMCCVHNPGNKEDLRSVVVTLDPKRVKNSQLNKTMKTGFNSLLPGIKVSVTVKEVVKNGLCVEFLKFKASVHRTHLPKPLTSYEKKKTEHACVLFKDPESKRIALTFQPAVVDNVGLASPTVSMVTSYLGELIEKAEVTKVDGLKGIHFKLKGDLQAYADLRHLNTKKVKAEAYYQQAFPVGSTRKCRVIKYFPLERLAIISLRQKDLDEKFLRLEDIKAGEIHQCKLEKLVVQGAKVRLTKHLTGFIPNMHLSDVTLKHPERKFSPGDDLKCRVLFVNVDKANLTLTNKKSLVKSKLPIITDYTQCEPGLELEGFIGSIKEIGVHVRFYNDIRGFVPRKYLSTMPIEYPEKVFYVGQVVKCRVVSVRPQDDKLILTFVLDGKLPFGKKKSGIPEDFEIGKIVSCTVLKKTPRGLDVVFTNNETRGFLPTMHLSDYVDLCPRLWDVFEEGDFIPEVMYYNKTSVVVTRKQSLLSASKEGRLVSDFSKVKVDMMIPGVIQRHKDYGVFVEFPCGLFCLVPTKYAADKRVPDLVSLYQPHQSVEVKVMEVKQEQQRFVASLRMMDCYHGDTHIGMQLTLTYLQEKEAVLEHYQKNKGTKKALTKFAVGSVHRGTVKAVNEYGVIFEMKHGVKGVATRHHVSDTEIEVGGELSCCVLYVDLAAECIEVSVAHKLVDRVAKGKHEVKVQAGEVVKAEVLHITADVVLVELQGQFKGQMAYLPGRRHLNDVLECHQYVIGQVNKVVIKSIEDGVILVSLKVHEDRLEKQGQEEHVVPHIPTHELEVGQVHKASVRKILSDAMMVKIGTVSGRLHVTEMLDTVDNGSFPLKKYKHQQKITVKIVGFRETKKWSYLPISHPMRLKAMPDCSVRPSILSSKEGPESFKYGTNRFDVGDKVVAFVLKYSNHVLWTKISPTVFGKVYVLNLSDSLDIKPEETFKPGTAYNATVVGKIDEKTVELSLTGDKAGSDVGTVTRALITSVKPVAGLVLTLGDGVRGNIDLTDLSDDYIASPVTQYSVGQLVKCYIISKDAQEKRAVCSLRESRLTGTKPPAQRPDVQSFDDLSNGQLIQGYIVHHVASGILLRLGHGITGRAEFQHITDKFIFDMKAAFPIGNVLTAKILSVDKKTKMVELSLAEKDTHVPMDMLRKYLSLKYKDRHRKKRKLSTSEPVDGEGARKKAKPDDSSEISGHRKKNEDESETLVSEMNETLDEDSAPKVKKTKKEKRKKVKEKDSEEVAPQTKKKKLVGSDDDDSGVEVSDQNSEALKRLEVADTFSWDTEFKMPTPSAGQGEVSSDDTDNEEDQRPVRKNKEELRKARQEEEKRLFELEKQRMKGGNLPETADDFDRLVLQSPNSSLIWLKYMAFYLETTQIDKARAVAERALKTIAFREEQEKLNVWFAYLNLENMYGSPESVKKLLTRATQQADQLKVYQQMINIYTQSGKTAEAEQIHNTLVKRHGQLLDVWLKFGQFYFQSDRHESARSLLQRSLKCLDKSKHVEVIAKFAQMEFKFGDPERGKTMFENVLSNYPKRTDLWSVYIDMVIKLNELDNIRQLFERVISLKVSAKKMKFFFKKYLQFEETHGDEAHVAEVKQKALNYVESSGYVEDL